MKAQETKRGKSHYTQRVSLPETGFVRLPTILALFPISESSYWAGVKSGRYPPGVKLSPRVTAWRVEDIRALIEQKSAQSGNKTARRALEAA